MSFSKIYKHIEKGIQGRKKKAKTKIKKIYLHKKLEELKEQKERRILDRIEDKIPSTFFKEE